MDYGKWRYQQQKKEDKSRASSRAGRLKQINIDTIRIGDHDLMIKIERARDFLKEGNKVQFTLRFKGREMAHLDLGRDLFVKIKQALWPVSKVERDAKMEGRRMTLVLQPEHKAPGAKPPPPPGTRPAMAVGVGARPGAPAPAGAGMNIAPRPAPVGVRPGGPVGPAAAPVAPRPAPVAPTERPTPGPVTAPAAAPAPAPASR